MFKIKIAIVLIIVLSFLKNTNADVIEIKVKIYDKIITNLDIENEKQYLFFLNPKLQELEMSRIDYIAKESLISEIIKKKELEKFYDFNENNEVLDTVEKNFLSKRNIETKEQFIQILLNKNLDYTIIKNKLYVETMWNQLVYQKYSSNLVINKEELKKNILNEIKKDKKKYLYNLSEIVFSENDEVDLNKRILQINKSIEEIGFENTSNIYSISNTSKTGGLIGWVNELQLSNKISNKIKDLKINEISKPIKIQNGYILIKLNDKKEFKQKVNINDQLKKLVNNETNRQLNNFSTIFFKKLKKNIKIDEK